MTEPTNEELAEALRSIEGLPLGTRLIVRIACTTEMGGSSGTAGSVRLTRMRLWNANSTFIRADPRGERLNTGGGRTFLKKGGATSSPTE